MAAATSEVARFLQAQKDIVALAYRDLLAFYRTLDLSDPVGSVVALERFLPGLIQAYGEIGASVAADFYDELRAQSPAVRQAYNAVLGDAVPLGAIQGSAKWAAAPLFREDLAAEATLGRVIELTDRFIKQAARNTVVENVRRDPARVRYARVPTGPTTCAFCLMLASRGPVYSDGDAEAHKYHGHCDCVPTPTWGDADLDRLKGETGYDPDSLYSVYKAARRETTSDSLKGDDGILAVIRKQQGVK